MLKKLSLYVQFSQKRQRIDFDETKSISFLIKNDELLEKYNEIWEKVKDSLKREFDSKPVYNKKYLKAKTKYYNGRINTNFHNNKIPKEDSQYLCLSVILIILLLGEIKIFIPRCFQMNANMLLKKKGFIIILLMTQEFLLILMKKLCQNNFRRKKNSDYEQNCDGKVLKKNSRKKKFDEENSDKENFDQKNFKKY